jgi:hypothetical protein
MRRPRRPEILPSSLLHFRSDDHYLSADWVLINLCS